LQSAKLGRLQASGEQFRKRREVARVDPDRDQVGRFCRVEAG
jgi:hypothetical protein